MNTEHSQLRCAVRTNKNVSYCKPLARQRSCHISPNAAVLHMSPSRIW